MDRCIKVSHEEKKNMNLKFKIIGQNPYKCVLGAFEMAGYQRTESNYFI